MPYLAPRWRGQSCASPPSHPALWRGVLPPQALEHPAAGEGAEKSAPSSAFQPHPEWPQIRAVKRTFLSLPLNPWRWVSLPQRSWLPLSNRIVQPLMAPGQAGNTQLEDIMQDWKVCLIRKKCPSPYKPFLSPPQEPPLYSAMTWLPPCGRGQGGRSLQAALTHGLTPRRAPQ